MPLYIRTEKCKNPTELRVDVPKEDGGGQDLDGVTKTLGFASMRFGIGKITEDNVDEVLRRVQALEKVYGPLMQRGPEGVLFTREDIERRIGMTTNVSPITKTKFDAQIRAELKKKE